MDRLRVKWKFDLDVPIETTPTVIGDTLYFGAPGAYYALDALTGQMKGHRPIPPEVLKRTELLDSERIVRERSVSFPFERFYLPYPLW